MISPDFAESINQQVYLICADETLEPDQPFTPEQRKELNDLLLKADSLPKGIKRISKYDAYLREWDKKYQEYGGNQERLKKRIEEVQEQLMKTVPPGMRWIVRRFITVCNNLERKKIQKVK